jgi:hypothetical protein
VLIDQSSGFLLHTFVMYIAPSSVYLSIGKCPRVAWPLHRDPTAELHAVMQASNKQDVWGVLIASCLFDRNGEMKIRALIRPILRNLFGSDGVVVLTKICNRCSQSML